MTRSLTGTLFVVATPIGNLEDITLRALRILKEVDLVAAEDTRRTGNLLRHYDIRTPLISLHEHNEYQRTDELVQRLQAGESVAVVSDAGTPGVSDPGARLVRAARQAGLRVDPIPGPSAITSILSASGMSLDRFAFAGFPPVRSNDRKRWLQWVEELDDTAVVFFEAPHRIHETLTQIRQLLVDRPIIVARELTKLHEEWTFLSQGSVQDSLPEPKGEFVVLIGAATATSEAICPIADAEIASLFGQIANNGMPTRRAAVKSVAQRLGMSPKAVYAALERVKSTSERIS
jgi:16S rRNA (cytidine1402-2'-O)-methyltransferase